MSENEHHARAKSRLHNGTTNEVTRAQAEATLALAYEQRTANLIALAELKRKERTSGSTAASTEVTMVIEERLGL